MNSGMTRCGRYRATAMIIALLVVGLPVGFALAATVHIVSQKNRSFDQKAIEITAGDAVRFTNDDSFLHQIFISSPALSFDSEGQPPGEAIDVRFQRQGTYLVLCHIHPTMRLNVTVR